MEIRVIISSDGSRVLVETISMLEDLWHDFEFFKSQAARFHQPSGSASDQLVAKRYLRVAVLTLIFYLEGVLNYWMKQLLSDEA